MWEGAEGGLLTGGQLSDDLIAAAENAGVRYIPRDGTAAEDA